MGKRLLFIDRDGTLVNEVPPFYRLDSFEKLVFFPHVFEYMRRIATELNYGLVMVTNQDGLGTETFPEEKFWPVHEMVMRTFENEKIFFESVLIDKSYPAQNAATRKPGTGMLLDYINNDGYDIPNSFVIGDRITDMQLAKNLGCKGIWLCMDEHLGASEISSSLSELKASTIVLQTSQWKDVYEYLSKHA